jgi:hypothetical protein
MIPSVVSEEEFSGDDALEISDESLPLFEYTCTFVPSYVPSHDL